jgi:hypothetical protein
VEAALWETGAYSEALEHLEAAARIRPDWHELQQQLEDARRRYREPRGR